MLDQASMAAIALPAAGAYRIDVDHSAITYSSRHMFGMGKVHANFTITSGQLDVAEALAGCRVAASVDAASFSSEIPRRDRDVKAAGFLDVAVYPAITFSSTAVHWDEGKVLVDGAVTAHGVTADATVAVTSLETVGGVVHVHARADHLDRYDFGITGAKGWAGRYFDLVFDVVAVPVRNASALSGG